MKPFGFSPVMLLVGLGSMFLPAFVGYSAAPSLDITLDDLLRQWQHEREIVLAQWRRTEAISSRLPPMKTDSYRKIIRKGNVILPLLVKKMQSNSGDLFIAAIFVDLTKVKFEDEFRVETGKIVLTDYNFEYIPYCNLADKNEYDSPYVYWWNHGRTLTPKLFEKKYQDYLEVKKGQNSAVIKEKYTQLQNMGIIILPLLVKKITEGANDLIPMFGSLSNQTALKTAADCQKWWNENKARYAVILNC
ncbi:MAG: hypothetical protein PHQ27_02895 [Victivallales bacterium]|nr:hypothetical protein [Victivallales bacterium]